MIIVDPVELGDAACTRPSPKWVFDRTGTLVEVPADNLAVSYDPADLSKAPFAVVDLQPATNHIRNSTMQGATVGALETGKPTNWLTSASGTNGVVLDITEVGLKNGIDYIRVKATGIPTGNGLFFLRPENSQQIPAVAGQIWAISSYIEMIRSTGCSYIRTQIYESDANNNAMSAGLFNTTDFSIAEASLGVFRPGCVAQLAQGSTTAVFAQYSFAYAVGVPLDLEFLFGMPQIEPDRITSPMKTGGGAVTRAADVIGPTAGLIYSNVPMVEPSYDPIVTYAKDALVRDPVTHEVYKSLIEANKGKLLTDEASWNSRGKTNRWAMFDDYNNTQTISPEEIVVVLSPQSICEGIYLGNVDADEIELVVVDQSEGTVFSEVISLVTASGSSSYYDWCFRPADRADYYFTVAMPPYASALVTVVLRKPGGVAKCGMAAIGLVDDFGPSLYGLSASGKDFSSTTFNFDGTSKTQYRDYAKKMDVDVQVNNGEIDYIQRKLFQLRQRPIVWIGGPYGATAVFGRYVSFDIVIPGLVKSDMSLQIEGSV